MIKETSPLDEQMLNWSDSRLFLFDVSDLRDFPLLSTQSIWFTGQSMVIIREFVARRWFIYSFLRSKIEYCMPIDGKYEMQLSLDWDALDQFIMPCDWLAQVW